MGVRDAMRALMGRHYEVQRRQTPELAPHRKSPTPGPLMALNVLGRPVWTPRQYDKFADEGYSKNIVVYRAITMLARAAAQVPWIVMRDMQDGDTEEVTDGPIIDLLRRPNPQMGWGEFIEAMVSYLMIAGNSYVEGVGPNGRPPRELWPLRPDRMKVVAGSLGLPQAYVYEVQGQSRRWEADPETGAGPVLHLKLFNPLNDWYGMSPMEAAAWAVDQRNQSDAWNMSLMQNGARPSGALVYKPSEGMSPTLPDDAYQRLRNELDEHHSGASNAGRPLLLEGGLDWREIMLSPRDLDFLNSKNTTSRDIAQAFGVPAQMLGIPGDNTYSNYQEARLSLYEDTLIPLLSMIRDDVNVWLAPYLGRGERVTFDIDEIPAMQVKRAQRWEQVRTADFLTINEKRQAVGYESLEGGDVLLVPSTLLPLNTDDGADDEDDPGEPVDDDEARSLWQFGYGRLGTK